MWCDVMRASGVSEVARVSEYASKSSVTGTAHTQSFTLTHEQERESAWAFERKKEGAVLGAHRTKDR
jgi:hypothetical protein